MLSHVTNRLAGRDCYPVAQKLCHGRCKPSEPCLTFALALSYTRQLRKLYSSRCHFLTLTITRFYTRQIVHHSHSHARNIRPVAQWKGSSWPSPICSLAL